MATLRRVRALVVGTSFPCAGEGHAVIWENGGLGNRLEHTLVPPGSDLQLTDAQFINDRGEITGRAVLSDGAEHAFLLIPDDPNDAAAASATDPIPSFGTKLSMISDEGNSGLRHSPARGSVHQ